MENGYRFIGIAPEVDLTERRSKMINDQTEPFTFDDMRGYKAFTALLTQSGESGENTFDSGVLTIGVTYWIGINSPGMDFTNVGAPNNNIGTYFIATGTTPNSWGNLSGTGNDTISYDPGAPVVNVLENTIGNIWFSYDAVATYGINSDNLFINNKTYITNLTPTDTDYQRVYGGNSFIIDINKLGITTLEIPNIMTDGLLNNTPIEIKVYN